MTPVQIKSFTATAVAIAPYLIVTAVVGGKVELANAATDLLLGTTDALGVDADQVIDITTVGVSEVTLGGAVAFGDKLTSDAAGKAVVAAGSAGVDKHTIGTAMAAGVANDVIPYQVGLGTLFTPA